MNLEVPISLNVKCSALPLTKLYDSARRLRSSSRRNRRFLFLHRSSAANASTENSGHNLLEPYIRTAVSFFVNDGLHKVVRSVFIPSCFTAKLFCQPVHTYLSHEKCRCPTSLTRPLRGWHLLLTCDVFFPSFRISCYQEAHRFTVKNFHIVI